MIWIKAGAGCLGSYHPLESSGLGRRVRRMRGWLMLAAAVWVCALLSACDARSGTAYVPCSEHFQSPDLIWLSIATRICTSLKEAARLSQQRDTPAGKAGIHQLYLDTFNVDEFVKHVTPPCIRRWGYTQTQIDGIIENKLYETISGFVLDRPEQFNSQQGAGLKVGPLGKKSGELLSKIVKSGQDDIDIVWDFVCAQGQCKVVDITVLSATLSDQVKASMQARCHR